MQEKQLPAFIGEIIAGLETVEIVKPDYVLGGNENIIGALPEDLQRLSSLRLKLGDDYNEQVGAAQAEIEAIDSRKEQTEAVDRLNKMLMAAKLKYDVVGELFWASVRCTFLELIDKERIGLGPDFQVYWEEKKEECDCPACQLKRGLGLQAGGLGISGLLASILQGLKEDKEPKPEDEEVPSKDEEQESEDETPAGGAETKEDAAAVEGGGK